MRANPGVNVWLPGEGTEVVLPTRFVLPPGPRRGIVLNLAEYRLYYFRNRVEGEAIPIVMTYPISIGRMDWETPLGTTQVVTAKVTEPVLVPAEVRARRARRRRQIRCRRRAAGTRTIRWAGARCGSGLPGYLIHGTNRPAGVGMRVTHGCMRMFPRTSSDLFPRVGVDTPVRIINARSRWAGSVTSS